MGIGEKGCAGMSYPKTNHCSWCGRDIRQAYLASPWVHPATHKRLCADNIHYAEPSDTDDS